MAKTLNLAESTIATDNVAQATYIFEKYGDFIRKIINYHVSNSNDAEDIYQGIFLGFRVKRTIPVRYGSSPFTRRSFINRSGVSSRLKTAKKDLWFGKLR